ncbi:MAG TPA: FAD-dependent oxidoreductase [Alphaproteobacteria bacterium]|nr:FAD-dependent oxidoreductase [Alphaproteobacteria bacterium]
MRVVICGGGAIAACTAYFLSRRGIDVTVVEGTGVACAASGKAGGFLALDWCAGSPLDALARRSFGLHAQLAGEIEGDWGYRPMTAYAGYIVPRRGSATLDWLSERVQITSRLGTPETTAIVHPEKFTKAMMHEAQRLGAVLREARVTGILRSGDGSVGGIETDGGRIAADAVVIAMGPWSLFAGEWLNLPPVFGRKSPSLVFDTGTRVPPDALFLDCEGEGGVTVTVEVFPRAGGNTYATAFSTEGPVPLDPAAVVPDPDALDQLQQICGLISPVFEDARVIARQACARPVTQDFMPLIGKVPGAAGAYVATGHNVWGILNAPATGEAMAALVVDGAAKVDLRPFDPGRLRPRVARR